MATESSTPLYVGKMFLASGTFTPAPRVTDPAT